MKPFRIWTWFSFLSGCSPYLCNGLMAKQFEYYQEIVKNMRKRMHSANEQQQQQQLNKLRSSKKNIRTKRKLKNIIIILCQKHVFQHKKAQKHKLLQFSYHFSFECFCLFFRIRISSAHHFSISIFIFYCTQLSEVKYLQLRKV